MNVGQLEKIIEHLPKSMGVVIRQIDPEFAISLLESANVEECTFSDGKSEGKDTCLVLSDEI